MVTSKFSVYSVFKYLFVAFITFIIVYPMLNIFAISFSDSASIMTKQVSFYPKGFNLRAYRIVFSNKSLLLSYWNTIKYVTLGTSISMVVTTCGAYALSKGRRLYGYKFFTIMILITMFFSGGLIPEYLTMRMLNMLDTTWVIVLIGAVSAWNLIVMRSFFMSIPQDLQDSGKIDGLNDYGILYYIVLPLSTPIIATISLFYGVALWNAYFTPYIYLKDTAKYPIQVILKQLLIAGTNVSQEAALGMGDSLILGESLVNATIIVSIIPIIVLYPFLQKYFVKGIMIGSLKE